MQFVLAAVIAAALLLGALAFLLNSAGGNYFVDAVLNKLSVKQTQQDLKGAADAIRDSDEDAQRQIARDRWEGQQERTRDMMETAASEAERSREQTRARQEQMQERLRAMQERMDR